MQHLKELTNASKLNKAEILSQPMTITLKIDGTALQVSSGKFYKRPDDPSKTNINKPLSKFDIALNNYYYEPYKYLKKKVSKGDWPAIMNFEILSDKEYHTIKYAKKFKNNIILLSAYDREGGDPYPFSMLASIAKKLDVALIECVLENDTLMSTGISPENLISKMSNPKAAYALLTDALINDGNDISDEEIEGFVIEIPDDGSGKRRCYKFNNPLFTDDMMDSLEEQRNSWCDYTCSVKMFLEKAESAIDSLSSKDHFERVVELMSEVICTDVESFADAVKNKDERQRKEYVTLNIDFIKDYDDNLAYECESQQEIKELVFMLILILKKEHAKKCFCDEDTTEMANELVAKLINFE